MMVGIYVFWGLPMRAYGILVGERASLKSVTLSAAFAIFFFSCWAVWEACVPEWVGYMMLGVGTLALNAVTLDPDVFYALPTYVEESTALLLLLSCMGLRVFTRLPQSDRWKAVLVWVVVMAFVMQVAHYIEDTSGIQDDILRVGLTLLFTASISGAVYSLWMAYLRWRIRAPRLYALRA